MLFRATRQNLNANHRVEEDQQERANKLQIEDDVVVVVVVMVSRGNRDNKLLPRKMTNSRFTKQMG